MRGLSPIIGFFHPNGVLLFPGDPLLNTSCIGFSFGAALIMLLLTTVGTGLWFRNVRK